MRREETTADRKRKGEEGPQAMKRGEETRTHQTKRKKKRAKPNKKEGREHKGER